LGEMDPGVEISLIAHRPPDAATGGRLEPVTAVQATGFGATKQAANELAAAAAAAAPGEPRELPVFDAVALDDLKGEGAWVEGLRYAVDMCWVTGGYREIGAICARAMAVAPSEQSRIVFAWGFAPDASPDVAQTANGILTINLYAI